MKDFVTDTHSLFWHLSNYPKLGHNAVSAFEDAEAGNALIHIPAIVFAELFYLNIKLGKPIDYAAKFREIEQATHFVLTPLDPEDILDFERDSSVSEMHDRMIVGLARRLGCPLLTRDGNIRTSGAVDIVW